MLTSPRLAAAAASTRTPQDIRILRLFKLLHTRRAQGHTTVTVNIADLGTLVAIAARSDAGVSP